MASVRADRAAGFQLGRRRKSQDRGHKRLDRGDACAPPLAALKRRDLQKEGCEWEGLV